jgi:hypothetical protein
VASAILPTGSVLKSIAVVSSNDIWAVGYEPNASYGQYALIEHWDGKKWSRIPPAASTPSDSSLNSVAAIASNNVWAVGDSFIEHWNGSKWSVIASPGKPFEYFTSVTATSAKDIWAVGQYGEQYNYNRLVEHWNGSTWSIVQSPTYSGLRENSIASVAANSTVNAWLVGTVFFIDDGYHFPQGFAEHWDGKKWSEVPVAHIGSTTQDSDNLQGVVSITNTNVWAVGSSGLGSTTLIEHWNGSKWQIVPSP